MTPFLHISTVDELRNSHKKWVEEILKTKNYVRESKWSQSIAVGSKSFVEGIKDTSKFDKGAFLYPTLPLKVLKKLI